MDGRIFQLSECLAERLDHAWTVEEMAALVDVSAPHFQKLFKLEVGKTPAAYLKDLRLERAKELLENTFLQIKQIGLQTGLINDSHFTRDFKRKFGTAPTEYRKRHWEFIQSNIEHD